MWKYVNILNAMIQILTTIGVGGIAGCVRVFEVDTFVAFMTQFVFSVSIPCLVIRGIGIGVDFYSEKFIWEYIVAFLILRMLALVFSLIVILISNWRKKEPLHDLDLDRHPRYSGGFSHLGC
jgi:hypothetical protein